MDFVLRRIPRSTDPNVLVGFETNDDAGVYQLSEDLALVHTVDFLTPIVDDPGLYGQISAANSLSDVYAMGGRPVSALSILAFPERGDAALLEKIIRGGLAKMAEAQCSVIGGHSVRDEEVKFGYAVTGVIHPKRVWRNFGAQPGDVLLLTKPIGTGMIATAMKNNRASSAWQDASIKSMTRLNRTAAEALADLNGLGGSTDVVHAVTDVTGFGLLGHAREMVAFGGTDGTPSISLEIDHTRVEYLPGAVEAAGYGYLSGGLRNNREFVASCVHFEDSVQPEYRDLLFDPQTSGGLLAAVAKDSLGRALARLACQGINVQVIGRAVGKSSPLISVI